MYTFTREVSNGNSDIKERLNTFIQNLQVYWKGPEIRAKSKFAQQLAADRDRHTENRRTSRATLPVEHINRNHDQEPHTAEQRTRPLEMILAPYILVHGRGVHCRNTGVPIYVFYWKGPEIRAKSKFAQQLAADRDRHTENRRRLNTFIQNLQVQELPHNRSPRPTRPPILSMPIPIKYHLQWASTLLGCVGFLVMIPIYVFYWKGPEIRATFIQNLQVQELPHNRSPRPTRPPILSMPIPISSKLLREFTLGPNLRRARASVVG
jgi:hypothetical protein